LSSTLSNLSAGVDQVDRNNQPASVTQPASATTESTSAAATEANPPLSDQPAQANPSNPVTEEKKDDEEEEEEFFAAALAYNKLTRRRCLVSSIRRGGEFAFVIHRDYLLLPDRVGFLIPNKERRKTTIILYHGEFRCSPDTVINCPPGCKREYSVEGFRSWEVVYRD
jgi:hypothetical protein